MTDREIAEQLPNLNIVKSFGKEFFLFIVEIILTIAVTFAIIYAMLGFSDESVWIKAMFTKGCTDTHLEGIFRKYEVIVDNNFYLFAILLVVCCILIIADFSYFILRIKYGDLNEKKEEVEEEVESAE